MTPKLFLYFFCYKIDEVKSNNVLNKSYLLITEIINFKCFIFKKHSENVKLTSILFNI